MSAPMRSTPREPARYTGSLGQLIHQLKAELHGRPANEWAERVLRHGARVALKRSHDGRRVLRLTRPLGPMPAGPARDKAWAGEIEIFLRHLGATRWEPITSIEPHDDALVAYFKEPQP